MLQNNVFRAFHPPLRKTFAIIKNKKRKESERARHALDKPNLLKVFKIFFFHVSESAVSELSLLLIYIYIQHVFLRRLC